MKVRHFTGKSHWEDGTLIIKISADFGYLLMYQGYARQFESISIEAKSYEEANHEINKIRAVRDFKQGGNTEVFLSDDKRLNDWLKKHKYIKIES